MTRILYLAWRYVAYNRVKTLILTAGLTLTFVLPLTVHLLIKNYGQRLVARAQATPLLVGAKGNRFDLVLKALYFTSAEIDSMPLAEADNIRDSGLGSPIPLNLGYTARNGKYPIVGTPLEYFEFRGLDARPGTLPRRLGDAVIGATVADELQLGPGDSLFSDQTSLYDISKTYPLKMRIVGVLKPSNSPDDRAVFVDTKTAWIIAGITHGHQDVSTIDDESLILERDEDSVATSDAIFEYNEVTPENIESFHTHADPNELPVHAVIVVPRDEKGATLLKGRYAVSESYRMLVPEQVVRELLGLVFRIKRFFDANFALVVVSTALFLALVILLSIRLRKPEMETMFKIGCSRRTMLWLQLSELTIVLAISVVCAGGLALLASTAAPYVLRLG